MALRNLISKVVFPNFERQLHGSIAAQVNTVPSMVDNMLAPQAFAYTGASAAKNGAFQTSGLREAPAGSSKVYLSVKSEGLFETAGLSK